MLLCPPIHLFIKIQITNKQKNTHKTGSFIVHPIICLYTPQTANFAFLNHY